MVTTAASNCGQMTPDYDQTGQRFMSSKQRRQSNFAEKKKEERANKGGKNGGGKGCNNNKGGKNSNWSYFVGSAIVTMALSMLNVPCLCPWEINNNPSMDVLKNGPILSELVVAGRLIAAQLATPCAV